MERRNQKWTQTNGDEQSMGTFGHKGFTEGIEGHNINMGM